MALGAIGLLIIVVVLAGLGLAAFALWSMSSKNKEDRK